MKRSHAGNDRCHVLFIEDSIGVSGSMISLCHLLSALDRRSHAAHVVFSREEQRTYWESYSNVPLASSVVIMRRPSLAGTRAGRVFARVARRMGMERIGRRAVALADLLFVTFPYALRLARFTRGKGIDLIQQNNGFYPALVFLGWMTGLPTIAYQRGREWHSRTVRLLARHVRWYVANSEATRDDLRELDIPTERICVVHPPVDLSRFDGRRACESQRREFGLREGQPCFGVVGHLLEWKGQDVFLRASRAVLEAIPEAKSFVIGGSPTGSNDYEESLRRLAVELGIGDRVVFTGFRRDVPQLLSMLDVVAHTSVSPEPFGRVIAEAMAMGKPVVASAAGGPLEIIRSGMNGFLVPPGNHEALAAVILRLLRDRSLAEQVGSYGQMEARRFSVEEHVRLMTQLYAKVLTTRGAVPVSGASPTEAKQVTQRSKT